MIARAHGCAGARGLEFAEITRRAGYLAGRTGVDCQCRASVCWLSGKGSAQPDRSDTQPACRGNGRAYFPAIHTANRI